MSVIKNPLSSTLLFGLFSFLRPGISVLLLPVLLNHLTPSDYGIISLVTFYATITSVIFSLGLKNSLYTFYFDYSDKDRLRQYLRNLYSLQFFFLIIGIGTHLLFGELIFSFLFSRESNISFFPYGLLAILSIFCTTANNLYFIFLKNEVNLKSFFIYSGIVVLLTATIQYVLVIKFHFGVLGFLLGLFIPNAFVFLLILVLNPYLITLHLKRALLKPSLSYGLKLFPFLILFALENQIETYLIEKTIGLESVGIYALLLKVMMLLVLVLNALDDGIRPFLYRDLKQNLSRKKIYFDIYLGFGVLVLAIIYILGSNVEYIIHNQDFLVIKKYLLAGILAFLFMIPSRYYGLLLVYYKESAKLSYITSCKIFFTVGIMLVLIPKYQIYGVLYAVLLSNVLNTLLFCWFLKNREYTFPRLKTIYFAICFIAATICLHYRIHSENYLVYSCLYLAGIGVLF
jgi:O-antigen/teichoic acid export membrane protein